MKSQIVPVIFFCLVFPWIVARVFQMEGGQKRLHENVPESSDKSRLVTTGNNYEITIQMITDDELSNKQMIYLIP
jgi:hypothetical protein